MRKLLLLKYASEIFLKGLNKGKFEKKLKDNIKNVLGETKYDFVVDEGRWFIGCDDMDEAIAKLKKVFGIAEICIVDEVEPDMDSIKEQCLKKYTAKFRNYF